MEQGGLTSIWCNILSQHKTFFVVLPKQNHIQLWVKPSQNLPTILYWLLHWKKFINHSEVCCYTTGWVAICFCAFLGTVGECIAPPYNFLSFLVCLVIFVYVSPMLLIPAQTRGIRITGHGQKGFSTSCLSFPIQPKLTQEMLFKVFAVVVEGSCFSVLDTQMFNPNSQPLLRISEVLQCCRNHTKNLKFVFQYLFSGLRAALVISTALKWF